MIFKKYFLYFILILSFLIYFSVYSNFNKDINIDFVGILSKNMYVDSNVLNNNLVLFKSNNDISNYSIAGSCVGESKFLRNKNDFYFFEFKVIKNCLNKNFYLKNDNSEILTKTRFEVNLLSKGKIIDTFTDYKTPFLLKLQEKIALEKNKFSLFASIDNTNKNIDFIQKARYLQELEYKEKIINHIIKKRQDKYNIPVLGHYLPNKNPNKLPNALRPYRANYTYGIHEGWDIDTKLGQEVVAIDDGVIVRIVDDFKWDDFGKIKKGKDLTYIDKINNLDIFRGNQVWLKTMKGDVVFYRHLDTVNKDIKVGDFVLSKTPLGTVGISGVPDKNYSDYHLHFELRKNPHLNLKAGKNTYFDYMRWDWYFKGKDKKYIIDNQYNIFKITD